jgi:hypothetical protein
MPVGLTVLANAVGAAGAQVGAAIAAEHNWEPFGIQVTGTFVGTVVVEATIATQAEVNALTATWTPIPAASWSAPGMGSFTFPATHIRANVTAWTSGNITVRAT